MHVTDIVTFAIGYDSATCAVWKDEQWQGALGMLVVLHLAQLVIECPCSAVFPLCETGE